MKKLTIFLILVIMMLLMGCASTQTPSSTLDSAAMGTGMAATAHGLNTAAGQAAAKVALPLMAVSIAKDIPTMPGVNKRNLTEDEKALSELIFSKRDWVEHKCKEMLSPDPNLTQRPHERIVAKEAFKYEAEQNKKTYNILCSAGPVYKGTQKRFIYIDFMNGDKPIIKNVSLTRVIDLEKISENAKN